MTQPMNLELKESDSSVINAPSEVTDRTTGDLTLRQQVLVLLGAILGIASGAVVFLMSLGIFLKTIAITFEWNRADTTLIPVLFMVGAAIGAPCIGYLGDRTGWRKTILISIALLSLGMLAMSLAPANHMYVISLAMLIGVVAPGTGAPGYLPILAKAFTKKPGMAFGLAMFGSSAAVAVIPIVASKLLESMDWRAAYLVFAGLCLLLGFVAHQLVFRVLATAGFDLRAVKAYVDSNNAIRPEDGISFGEAISGYRFWIIVVAVSIQFGVVQGVGVHLPSLATDQGISLSYAAQVAGLVGLAGAGARLGVALILDKVYAPLLAFVVFLSAATGLYFLSIDISQTLWLLPLAAILLGAANGAEGDIVPFLARKYFGTKAFGTINGAMYSFILLSSAFSTYLYGWSFDLMKSYVPMLQVAAILCGISGLAMLTLGRYQYGHSRNG